MVKSSTLLLHVHNLASQIQTEVTDSDDFNLENQFQDVFAELNNSPLFDVKQETVDKILQFAKDL